jgi:hypothetical protein
MRNAGSSPGPADDGDAHAASASAPKYVTTDAARVRSREAFSAAVGPHVADLLFQYGAEPEAVAALGRVVACVDPAASFSLARGAKALTDLLFQLQRLINAHATAEPLDALALGLASLQRSSDGATARQAAETIEKLVSSLAVRCTAAVGRLTASEGAGGGSPAKGKLAKKGSKKAGKKSSAATADGDIDMDGGDAAEADAASSGADPVGTYFICCSIYN